MQSLAWFPGTRAAARHNRSAFCAPWKGVDARDYQLSFRCGQGGFRGAGRSAPAEGEGHSANMRADARANADLETRDADAEQGKAAEPKVWRRRASVGGGLRLLRCDPRPRGMSTTTARHGSNVVPAELPCRSRMFGGCRNRRESGQPMQGCTAHPPPCKSASRTFRNRTDHLVHGPDISSVTDIGVVFSISRG